MTGPDLAAAWDALHAALPPGWQVGRPSLHHEDRCWHLYAWDPSERPRVGKRSRELRATGETEAVCVRAMARALRSR